MNSWWLRFLKNVLVGIPIFAVLFHVAVTVCTEQTAVSTALVHYEEGKHSAGVSDSWEGFFDGIVNGRINTLPFCFFGGSLAFHFFLLPVVMSLMLVLLYLGPCVNKRAWRLIPQWWKRVVAGKWLWAFIAIAILKQPVPWAIGVVGLLAIVLVSGAVPACAGLKYRALSNLLEPRTIFALYMFLEVLSSCFGAPFVSKSGAG
jgi:ABC-type antimicrobial peptide transport system permease subunit